ncbi:hypothetical protein ACQ33O_05345 [Ferruginibacter sp. SUN002]|uniref:hypothetical protein n=1 Tax=Ferruginibacter sp. SUN002 TaxID=2937789 RepID=UPI003D3612F6
MSIKKTLFVLVINFFLYANLFAQQTIYNDVSVTCEKNISGDTIWIVAKEPITQNPGTLLITALHIKSDLTDSIFLPMIDTLNYFALVIPKNYQDGRLKITAFFYPKIFEISGMVLNNINDETIKALVITKNKKLYNKELKLTDDRQFQLPGLIFEGKASLIFNYNLTKKKEKPNIIIQQSPSVEDFTAIVYAGEIPLSEERYVDTVQTITSNKNQAVKNKQNKSVTMQEVVVTSTKKSKVEKYSEEFVTPLFSDINERVIDCLDNNAILGYSDCLSFLNTKIPGLTSNVSRFGETVLRWRGKNVSAFYIDEINVDIDQLLSMPVTDIAIIKAFPPPFFGGSGGGSDGGAIAVYTRQGEYKRENTTYNKWLFPINGYSPAIHILFDGQ